MLKFNEETAIKNALELAKAICMNPNYQAQPCTETANNLADFIRTLEARFLIDDPLKSE